MIGRMSDSLVERVRSVIRGSQLTQSQFADAINLDPTKLTKSLKGRRRFSSLELARIAEVSGRSVDWFLTGYAPERVFAHRALQEAADIGDEVGRERIDLVVDRVIGLEVLGRKLDVPALPRAATGTFNIGRASTTAERYLERFVEPTWLLPTGELINRVEAVFGVNVIVMDLPHGCDGMAYVQGDARVIVLATSSNAPARQRFTLAHELGHIAFGDADQPIEERLWADKGRSDELRANTFAANFLAPGTAIREFIGNRTPEEAFDDLVGTFQLAPDTMAYRLLNEDLIDKATQERLGSSSAKQVAFRSGRAAQHSEQVELAGRTRPPRRLVGAYLEAYQAGETTLKPAATLLGWTLEHAEQVYSNDESGVDLREF